MKRLRSLGRLKRSMARMVCSGRMMLMRSIRINPIHIIYTLSMYTEGSLCQGRAGNFVVYDLARLLVLGIRSRHPTAERTLQQFREALPGDHPYRFLIHDRDSIFAKEVDQGLANLEVRVLRTPLRAPKANAVCERVGGSLRRECLDFLLPLNERHLQRIIREWTTHYNRGRPHSASVECDLQPVR